MGEFLMPSLGADMEAGTVVEWRVKQGDEVHRGDIVAVVDTDKADIDVEIFEAGVVEQVLVPVGQRVAVGTPLAVVATGAKASEPPPKVAPAAEPAVAPAVDEHAVGKAALEEQLHSPVLRRLAHHLGVDLTEVEGTGEFGRITRDDIERASRQRPSGEGAGIAAEVAAPHLPAAVVAGEVDTGEVEAGDVVAGQPVAGVTDTRAVTMRRAIANLMSRANAEIPHYYVAAEIDLDAAMTWLARANEQRPVSDRVLPAALLLKAVAMAARLHPQLNGFWVGDELRPADHVHVGVAISLRGGGLVAPALHDADGKALDTLMTELRDLVERARSGHLRSSEMSDPTITVTNLGDQGVDEVCGVIYPPQVALVGLGRISRRPVAVGELIGIHPVVRVSLAGDHRATDGHLGARFLTTIDKLLQRPEELWTPAPP